MDIIQDLVDAYNDSRHRFIGMAPADYFKKNEKRFWVRLFKKEDTYFKPQMFQQAMVRASSHKKIYDKRYMLNCIKEHFKVS